MSAHDLQKLVESLQPRLTYQKPVRQVFGGFQFIGGVLEAGGGAFTAIVTAETVAGAAAGGAVALHGIDTASSGWTTMWTGEQSKTWTFMAGAGYATMATDDPEMQNAIGQSVELIANIGSAAHGVYSLGSLPGPKLTVPGAVLNDSETVALGAKINTGPGAVSKINCWACTSAGGSAVPMSSSEVAAFSGLSEMGNIVGDVGVSRATMGNVLKGMGLGSGTPDMFGANRATGQELHGRVPQRHQVCRGVDLDPVDPWGLGRRGRPRHQRASRSLRSLLPRQPGDPRLAVALLQHPVQYHQRLCMDDLRAVLVISDRRHDTAG